MNLCRRIFPAMAMILLAGCFQVDTVVRVNQDGSGTVVETMLLSKRMIARMNEMMQGFAGENGAKPAPMELFDPAKLKAQAAGMGEGVTYLSGEKSEMAEFSGYRATYAFRDITKLKLNQKADDPPGGGVVKKPSMPVRFSFSKGPPATLTIDLPREKVPEKVGEGKRENAESPPQPAEGSISDAEAEEAAEMFMGLKMGLAVEVNGPIVETNATHRNGSRITIIDFDLAKFGSSLPRLEILKRLQWSSAADAKELMKGFPGMRVDLNDRVKVVFGE